MNLEQLGVQEMKSNELVDLNGGGPPVPFTEFVTNGTTHGAFGANGFGYALEAGRNGFVMGGNVGGLTLATLANWFNN